MGLMEEIKQTIVEAIEDAEVHILDPMNDGIHLEAIVISKTFEGQTLVKQHQRVMQPLKNHFSTTLHALALKTFTPQQWRT